MDIKTAIKTARYKGPINNRREAACVLAEEVEMLYSDIELLAQYSEGRCVCEDLRELSECLEDLN